MRATVLPALLIGLALGPAALAAQQTVPDTLDGEVYHELRAPRVRLRFVAGDSLVAVRVLRVLQGEAPLPGLPDSVPSGVVAVLPRGERAFRHLLGGATPEWTAGVAIPSRNLLIVPANEVGSLLGTEGGRILRHEWAHLGLHDYLSGLRIPRWFDEGYAQWASGGWDASEAWRLRILFALGHAPPMDSLSLTWPRDRASAEAAYLLSASAVSYLFRDSGARGASALLSRWKSTGSLDEALRSAFGVTRGQFESNWRRYAKSHYGWLFVLSHSVVFWMLLGLVLLFLMRIRVGRNRERMARLRASEGPDEPAFWNLDEESEESGGSGGSGNDERG